MPERGRWDVEVSPDPSGPGLVQSVAWVSLDRAKVAGSATRMEGFGVNVSTPGLFPNTTEWKHDSVTGCSNVIFENG